MSEPGTRWLDLAAGRFRTLEWEGGEPAAIFLHGLTGVAEVWAPTIERLGKERRRCIAIDQRGHGQSTKPAHRYSVAAYVRDLLAVMDALELERPHLVGHSMGARVALVAAARRPGRFQSVAIVDIGPEAWRANWVETWAAFERMPKQFASMQDATRGGVRARDAENADAALASSSKLQAIAEARFETGADGSVRWRADIEALKQAVKAQRSRGYWREWRALQRPALLIRGGESRELRPHIAERMRAENPRVDYLEMEGIGHNIPLLAPAALANALQAFWQRSER